MWQKRRSCATNMRDKWISSYFPFSSLLFWRLRCLSPYKIEKWWPSLSDKFSYMLLTSLTKLFRRSIKEGSHRSSNGFFSPMKISFKISLVRSKCTQTIIWALAWGVRIDHTSPHKKQRRKNKIRQNALRDENIFGTMSPSPPKRKQNKKKEKK